MDIQKYRKETKWKNQTETKISLNDTDLSKKARIWQWDSILFKYAQHLTQIIILQPPQEIKEMKIQSVKYAWVQAFKKMIRDVF